LLNLFIYLFILARWRRRTWKWFRWRNRFLRSSSFTNL